MMMGTTIINGVLGLVAIITYVLVIQDVDEQIPGLACLKLPQEAKPALSA
jgi:hypothetical protein